MFPMRRIFLPPEDITSDIVTITGDQARHLTLVLRVKPSDMISVMAGNGYEYKCRIVSVHKKEIRAEVISKAAYSAESPISITIAQGISKGERMDIAIQKSTELGAVRVVPVITERTQIKQANKTERWRRIALSAAQQSGRDKTPDIVGPTKLEEFLDSIAPGSDGIIFFEEKRERNLKEVLAGFKKIKEITILIGPEGGFTKEEVAAATEKGFVVASLGPRILRTETAPITALSIIQYELGDMG
ncbi:MAG TPA: 16S rRNA (uracil(1498)-N(3))-methyltransferase [Nitrospirae bacterium]|nr:16S rRNA (uracil(1498)-N(3))-methyltransferase [Nitrospirota bacterium]HEW81009.1 16S rRNA (uracil(1498)-N(3))-methyltransferase [Nitrospirota bacterium]